MEENRDKLTRLANGEGLLKGILLFLAFSAVVALIGYFIGVFDATMDNPDMYGPPPGERR